MKFKPGDIVERLGGHNFCSSDEKYGRVLSVKEDGWCEIEGEYYHANRHDSVFDIRRINYYNPNYLIKVSSDVIFLKKYIKKLTL